LLLTVRVIKDEQEIVYPTGGSMYSVVPGQNPLRRLSVSLPDTAGGAAAERQVSVNEQQTLTNESEQVPIISMDG
jgi:hypothetical protein